MITTSIKFVLDLLRWDAHEVMAEGVFKSEEASFNELEGVNELALQSKEFGEVKETLVVVKVSLEEFY